MSRPLVKADLCVFLFFLSFLAVFFSSCRPDKFDPQPDTTPKISSFTPIQGPEGASVVITGENFSDIKANNIVKFNGKSAEVTQASATEITTKVPEDATTGKITITVGDKTAYCTTDFIIDASMPSVTSFTPARGNVGEVVTIIGTNFKAGAKVIFEENKEATNVVVVSKTEITAEVPVGARSGKIIVKIDDLISLSPMDFYLPLTISSVSTYTGLPGATLVQIAGANFTSQTKVFFGAAEAIPSYRNDHFMEVVVPEGATTGKIRMVHADMEAESPVVFTVMQPLSITSVTPDHGATGTLLTIQGTNFQPGAQVVFEWGHILVQEAVATDIHVVSSTEMTARVPADLITYPLIKVKVTSGDRMGYYSMAFYSAPIITSITPLQASHYPDLTTGSGNTVTILGQNLTIEPNDASETTVQFGSVNGEIVNLSYGYIEVRPPAGLPANSTISVTIKGMTVTSTEDFTILPSVVSHDAHGTIGQNYTIEGDFLPNAELYINGIKMIDFTEKTSSKMTFKVPVGTTNGPVTVEQAGIVTKVFDFVL